MQPPSNNMLSNSTFTATDHAMMARALRLAERGAYTTKPNPMVGCVVAHGEEIVGEGWHQRAGEPHAEVHALRAAGERAKGATAYVTLEPCAHTGRTGPCADALLAARIARVVSAVGDPFPQVAGRGHEKLRAQGVAVETGLMEDAARELNRGFFQRLEYGRPWVRLKLDASLDGRVALAGGECATAGAAALADAMRWRARSSAVLSGIGTVLADDPHLTVRLAEDERFVPPLRVVLDSHLRIPARARVLDSAAPSLVVCAPEVVARGRTLPAGELLSCPHHATGLGLGVVLAELAQRALNEVQVEAGPTLSGALLHAGLVDEVLLYLDLAVLGDTAVPLFGLPPLRALADRARFRLLDQRQVGEALRLLLRPVPAP